MLSHKQKVKLARKISGKQTGHFTSPQWMSRALSISKRVIKKGGKK